MVDKAIYLWRNARQIKVWFMKSGCGKDLKKDKLDERIYYENKKVLADIDKFLT
jgi:hypothetical protein